MKSPHMCLRVRIVTGSLPSADMVVVPSPAQGKEQSPGWKLMAWGAESQARVGHSDDIRDLQQRWVPLPLCSLQQQVRSSQQRPYQIGL